MLLFKENRKSIPDFGVIDSAVYACINQWKGPQDPDRIGRRMLAMCLDGMLSQNDDIARNGEYAEWSELARAYRFRKPAVDSPQIRVAVLSTILAQHDPTGPAADDEWNALAEDIRDVRKVNEGLMEARSRFQKADSAIGRV